MLRPIFLNATKTIHVWEQINTEVLVRP
jgi:hypothetical protein